MSPDWETSRGFPFALGQGGYLADFGHRFAEFENNNGFVRN